LRQGKSLRGWCGGRSTPTGSSRKVALVQLADEMKVNKVCNAALYEDGAMDDLDLLVRKQCLCSFSFFIISKLIHLKNTHHPKDINQDYLPSQDM
jgi:hypothetical protein